MPRTLSDSARASAALAVSGLSSRTGPSGPCPTPMTRASLGDFFKSPATRTKFDFTILDHEDSPQFSVMVLGDCWQELHVRRPAADPGPPSFWDATRCLQGSPKASSDRSLSAVRRLNRMRVAGAHPQQELARTPVRCTVSGVCRAVSTSWDWPSGRTCRLVPRGTASRFSRRRHREPS